jgi:threonine synthase
MDIQVASNFERALFEASRRDAGWVSHAMGEFAATRALTIPPGILRELQETYLAASADDSETVAAIARVHRESAILIDPHTAVGVVAAEKLTKWLKGPVVLLATAHPAKFTPAITQAIGKTAELPPKLDRLMVQEERYTVLPNGVGAVKQFILERANPS